MAGCISENSTGSSPSVIMVRDNIETLFSSCRNKTVDNYDGIILEDVVAKSGVSNPEKYSYTIVGSDGYQKTVKWADIQQGILTQDRMVVFPNLPKMYWIRDVVEVRLNG